MSDPIGFKFDGGKELVDALAKLPARLSKSMLRESLRYAAEKHLKPAMERHAPRSPGGGVHLADQILVRTAHGRGVAQGLPAIAVGPSKGTWYGAYFEFGTSRQAARPWARPSFDETADPMLQTMGRDLWVELAGRGVHRTATAEGGLGGGLV